MTVSEKTHSNELEENSSKEVLTPAQRRKERWAVLYIIFSTYVASGALVVLFPLYLREKGFSSQNIGFTLFWGALFFQVVKISVASLSDYFSRKIFLQLASLGKTISYPALGLPQLLPYVTPMKITHDSVVASGRGVDYVSIIDVTEESELGRVLGITVGILVFGIAAGSMLSGIIKEYLGSYQLAFLFFGLISFSEFIIATIFLKKRIKHVFPGIKSFLLELFSIKELNRKMRFFMIISILYGAGDAIVTTMTIPLFLKEQIGLSLESVGILSSLNVIAFGICTSVFGGLADRYEAKNIFALGLFFSSIMYFLTVFVNSLYGYIFLFVASACAYGIGWPGTEKIVADETAGNARLYNLAWLGFYLGYSLGPAIAGVVLTYSSYEAVFLIRAIMFLGSAVLSYLLL